MSLLKLAVQSYRGNDESRTKSNRVAAANSAKREVARKGGIKPTSICPGWLRLSEDRMSYEIIPEREAVIKRIFQMATEGMGKRVIARKLNHEGLDAWGTGGKKGDGWRDSYVAKILTNASVHGEFQQHQYISKKRVKVGEPIENYFPAVLSRDEFRKVQLKRYTNTPGRHSPTCSNLFAGLIFDGYNQGSPMVYTKKSTAKRGSDRWTYFVSDAQRKNKDAKPCRLQYTDFEDLILDFIGRLDWKNVAAKNEAPKLSVQVDTIKSEIEALNTKLDRLTSLASSTDRPPARLLEQMGNLESKLATKTAELKSISIGADLEADAQNVDYNAVRRLIASKTDPAARMRLRAQLRSIIDKITVYPFGLEKGMITLPEPLMQGLAERGTPLYRINFRCGVERWLWVCPNKTALAFDAGNHPSLLEFYGNGDHEGKAPLAAFQQTEEAL